VNKLKIIRLAATRRGALDYPRSNNVFFDHDRFSTQRRKHPMIAGYHLILGTYGFWLPNDPRGSWSEFVRVYELFQHGPATKTTKNYSVAHDAHDHEARLAAKKSLRYPPVRFTGVQAQAVGRGFAEYFAGTNIDVWACAIMPDHLHLVTGHLPMKAEQLAVLLKGAATRYLVEHGLHPFQNIRTKKKRRPPCFARGEWKVFLDFEHLLRAIPYVEKNPEKDGKPRQRWSFVTRYSGLR
jgi:REP element-mobilizing transposase RayT